MLPSCQRERQLQPNKAQQHTCSLAREIGQRPSVQLGKRRFRGAAASHTLHARICSSATV